MTTIRYLALCLAILMMLSMLVCLFCIVFKLDHKIELIQQNQLLESEKYKNMCDILKALQEVNNVPIVIILEPQFEQTEQTEAPQQTDETHTKENSSTEIQTEQKPDESSSYPNYYGRLCIPDAGIDVALYYGADQAICDREDSANLFSMSVFDGLYISDHNNQEFAKLVNVTVGMVGYLRLADGAKFNIVCTDVFVGRNTGKYIVDMDGNTNLDGDYLMYTCRDSWQNILICMWKHI